MNDESYIKSELKSDKAWMESIGNFIQTHRLSQNRTQDQVATDASVSRSTLSLMERGENIRLDSLIRVLRVLELLHALDGFVIHVQISPIEYAKLKKKQRRQASPRKNKNQNSADLGW